MSMVSQFDADVQAIEPELPMSFVWMGKTISATQNSSPDGKEMADAGFISTYDLEIVARVSAFAGVRPPEVNDSIRIQNPITKAFANYRIDKFMLSQDGVCFTLGLLQQL